MQERWLSAEEIAAHLGVNRETIYRWLSRKKMPAHKVGRLWKFLVSEVDAWAKGGKGAQGAERVAQSPAKVLSSQKSKS